MTTDPQTTRSFWDEQHRIQHSGNLTGSSPEDELGNLRAMRFVQEGARVLNIGVGMGHTTEFLLGSGCEVSVHDIAAVAMEPFKGRAQTYLPEELPLLPTRYFDLVLSHLVMQHMNDEALVPQIRHVIRSLGKDGIFAFQFATGWDQTRKTFRFSEEVHEALPYCRTLGWMSDIVEAAGGVIVFAELAANFEKYKFAWYVAHVVAQGDLPRYIPKSSRVERRIRLHGRPS